MSQGIDRRAELEQLYAQREALRNEYMEAIRLQDAARGQPAGEPPAPPGRTVEQIDADLVRVDTRIDESSRALAQEERQALIQQDLQPRELKLDEPIAGKAMEAGLEIAEAALKAKDVILEGALGGPTGQAISQSLDVMQMQMQARGMIVDGLAEAHVNTRDTERENALLDEIRRVDLDPQLGKTLEAIDEKYALKKQEVEGKLATLQEKFDERHADKSADEKVKLQAALDKQFEELRAQIEKAQEQERQRALDRNKDDPFRNK